MRTTVKNVPVYDRKTKASVTIDVDLEIDTYSLAAILAKRAYDNKSGKSGMAHNNIKAIITRRPAKEVA